MFEGIVASVVNRLIGEYVSNLSSKQLDISVWKGDVSLTQLKLRRDALDKFELPMEVHDGTIGSLILKIPWQQLNARPVRVFISDLTLLAGPRAVSRGKTDAAETEKRLHRLKMERLETAAILERAEQEASLESAKEHKDETFVSSLVTKVVDNIQVVIKNIHIRYEDRTTDPLHPFCFGITLDELSAVSTDASWKETFVSGNDSNQYKLLQLSALTVYWHTNLDVTNPFTVASSTAALAERQPLLRPVNGTGRLTVRRRLAASDPTPRTLVNVYFDEIGFTLDDTQWRDICRLMDMFSYLQRAQEFAKYRPLIPAGEKTSARLWWRFACDAVMARVQARIRPWTWQSLKERRAKRYKYVSLYAKVLNAPQNVQLPAQEAAELDRLEHELSFEDLRLYRSLAAEAVKQGTSLQHAQKKKKANQSNSSWFGLWRTGPEPVEQAPAVSDAPKTPTAPVSRPVLLDLPKDAILTEIHFHLRSGSLGLSQRLDTTNQDLFTAEFNGFTCVGSQRPLKSMSLSLTLSEMALKDSATPGTLYPFLVQAKASMNDVVDMSTVLDESQSMTRDPFFRFQYEYLPLHVVAQHAIDLKMRPLELVYSLPALERLRSFFQRPDPSVDKALDALLSAANNRLDGLMNVTRAGLQYALEAHEQVHVKVDLSAPLLLMPAHVTDKESELLVANLGRLRVETEQVVDAQQAQQQHEQEQDIKQLEKLMYDRYSVSLSSLQLLYASQAKDYFTKDANKNVNLSVTEPVDVQLALAISIVPRARNLARMQLKARIPKIRVHFSDVKYKCLMRVLNEWFPVEKEEKNTNLSNASLPTIRRATEATLASPMDRFYDASATSPLPITVASFADMDYKQHLIEFDLLFDSISATLTQSDQLLAEMVAEHLSLSLVRCALDMKVEVKMRSFCMEDKMQKYGPPCQWMMSSLEPTKEVKSDADLLVVQYRQMDATNPDFHEFDQLLDIHVQTINVVVVRRSLLTLLNFLTVTFNGNVVTTTPSEADQNLTEKSQSKLRIRAHLKSLVFHLFQQGHPLSRIALDNGQVQISLYPNTLLVKGQLASVTVDDASQKYLDHYRPFLRMEGENVADFSFTTFDANDSQYPGYDSAFILKSGSMHVTYMHEFMRRFMSYIYETLEMVQVSVPLSPTDVEFNNKSSKFHYDILVKTPIVDIPRYLDGNQSIIAYLGELKCTNQWKSPLLEEIQVTLTKMHLIAQLFETEGGALTRSQIINDIDLSLVVSQPCSDVQVIHETFEKTPGMILKGALTPIDIELNEQQYVYLMDLFMYVTSTVSSVFVHDLGASQEFVQGQQQKQHNQVETTSNASSTSWMKGEFMMPRLNFSLLSRHDSHLFQPLARLVLDGMRVEFEQKEKNLNVEFSLQEGVIQDTRPGKRPFTDVVVLKRNEIDNEKEKVPLLVRYSEATHGNVVYVALNAPRVLLVLDQLFAVQRFILAGFVQTSTTTTSLSVNEATPTTTSAKQLLIECVMSQASFYLLEDSSQFNTDALHFHCHQFIFTQRHTGHLSLLLEEVGLDILAMAEEEKSLRFVDPFQVQVTQEGTSWIVELSALVFRVAYQDVLLVLSIIQRASVLASETAQDKQQNQVQKSSSMSSSEMTLTFHVQRLQWVLIDDVTKVHLPMLDLHFHAFQADISLSPTFSLVVPLKCHVHSFNLRNSQWEPLLEPWHVQVQVREESSLWQVAVASEETAQFNLTQTTLRSMMRTVSLLGKSLNSRQRVVHEPYRIVNQTAYPITVWNDSQNMSPESTLRKRLAVGESTSWTFVSWRKMREGVEAKSHFIAFQVHFASWQSQLKVPVDFTGTQRYVLRPRYEGLLHSILVHIHIHDSIKVVSLQSPVQVCNHWVIPMQVLLVDEKEQALWEREEILPGAKVAIPCEWVQSGRALRVRPYQALGYAWSGERLSWQALDKKTHFRLSCLSSSHSLPFYGHVEWERSFTASTNNASTYPYLNIHFYAPMMLENNLPFPVEYRLLDRGSSQDFGGGLAVGAECPFHSVDLYHFYCMRVSLTGTEYRMSEPFIVHDGTEDQDQWEKQVTLWNTTTKSPLVLLVSYFPLGQYGLAKKVVLSAPYIIMNRTGLRLFFKQESFLDQNMSITGDLSLQSLSSEWVSPLLFSYSQLDLVSNRASVRVGETSDWSATGVSLDAVGRCVEVTCDERGSRYHFGLSVEASSGKYASLTKLITVTPRFILCNETKEPLEWQQALVKESHALSRVIPPSTQQSLYLFHASSGHQETIQLKRIHLPESTFSVPFPLRELGVFHLRSPVSLADEMESTSLLWKVDISCHLATLFIRVSVATEWPMKVMNQTDVSLSFYQKGAHRLYACPAGQSLDYAWDEPCLEKKEMVLKVGTEEKLVDGMAMGKLGEWRLTDNENENSHLGHKVLVMERISENNQLVLYIAPSTRSENQGHNQSQTSLISQHSHVSSHQELFSCQISFSGMALSLMNESLEELLYFTLTEFDFTWHVTKSDVTLSLMIGQVQVDNQLYGTLFPVLLHGVNSATSNHSETPTSATSARQPLFKCVINQLRDKHNGIDYFPYWSALLQEWMISLDEPILLALLDFMGDLDLQDGKNENFSMESLWKVPILVTVPKETSGLSSFAPPVYFQLLHLHPIKLYFTLHFQSQQRSRLPFLLQLMTSTLGHVEQVPFQWNALILEKVLYPRPLLLSLLMQHYRQQLLGQWHKLLGSADLLGNPLGLWHHVASGVQDLFYEPYLGWVQDEPGHGLARGGVQFVKKTVHGLSDGVSRFTGAVSQGLAVMTMDRQFQLQRMTRRMNTTASSSHNTPVPLVQGVKKGVSSFTGAVVSGVSGLVEQPWQGVQREGAVGLFKGIGKSLVGVVTKPVIGVLDLASHVTQGIKNSTVSQKENWTRQRWPRVISANGLLKPYDAVAAQGQSLWRESALLSNTLISHEFYISHITCTLQTSVAQGHACVAVLTTLRTVLVDTKRMKWVWFVSHEQLLTPQLTSQGLLLLEKDSPSADRNKSSTSKNNNQKQAWIPCVSTSQEVHLFCRALNEAVSAIALKPMEE